MIGIYRLDLEHDGPVGAIMPILIRNKYVTEILEIF